MDNLDIHGRPVFVDNSGLKSLRKIDVKMTAEDLIGKNGQTSTLEIKTALRGDCFRAYQTDVSSVMIDLASEGKFEFEDNGSYRTYTLPSTSVSTTSDSSDDSFASLDCDDDGDEDGMLGDDYYDGSEDVVIPVINTTPKLRTFRCSSPGWKEITFDNTTRNKARYAFAKEYLDRYILMHFNKSSNPKGGKDYYIGHNYNLVHFRFSKRDIMRGFYSKVNTSLVR